jgi:RNA 2',3'-cyclic 3'-phosphodiesterase
MPETWRLFLAVNLTDEVRAAVHDATIPLRRAAPGLRWVAPERLHLTMKFLGATAPDATQALISALTEVAATHAAFAMELSGLGAFPNLRQPRVVWLGVTPDPKLELLQHDVEARCAALGHPLDGRVFRPHLTLARASGGTDARFADALRSAARAVQFQAHSPVASVDVMRSEASPDGVRYAVLASMRLAGLAA